MKTKRWRGAITLLVAYAALLFSVQAGLWARFNGSIWQRMNFTSWTQYGALRCVTDISAGPTVTGLAALALPIAFATSWPRRFAMTGGWLGLTALEAVQHAAVPIQAPPPVPAYREPAWCSRLQHIVDLGVPDPASAVAHLRLISAPSHPARIGKPLAHAPAHTNNSFPSGHALRLAYDLSLAAAGLFHGRAVAWTAAAVLGLAQGALLLGLHWHWATDVLGAWFLAGAGSLVLIGRNLPRPLGPARRRKPGRPA